MLNSLVIKNFRMLEDFTVSKLGRVNLIVGKNNSGKSTVLEALRIYAWNAHPKLLEIIAESHDEVFQQNGSRFLYEDLFTDRKFPNSKHFETEEDYHCGDHPSTEDEEIYIAESSAQSDLKKLYIWSTGEINYLSRGAYESFQAMGVLEIEAPNIKPKTIPCSFVPTQFASMDRLEHEWNAINLTDNEDIVAQALQIIAPDFKRLAFDGNKEKRWVKVKLANLPKPVPLKSLGDGMLRILQIAIKLVSAQGGFLLIDEFENGLHYSVQEKIWTLLFEMAEKLDIQVFATTHSWDCIESFSKVAFENETTEGVLFRMGRSAKTSNKGQIIATVFDRNELHSITQADMEIR